MLKKHQIIFRDKRLYNKNCTKKKGVKNYRQTLVTVSLHNTKFLKKRNIFVKIFLRESLLVIRKYFSSENNMYRHLRCKKKEKYEEGKVYSQFFRII